LFINHEETLKLGMKDSMLDEKIRSSEISSQMADKFNKLNQKSNGSTVENEFRL